MAKYVYPAVFTKEGNAYSIVFPDLESCYTCGDNLEDGYYMAEDVLAYTLFDMERDNVKIPEPSDISKISVQDGEFVSYVACDTLEYHKRNSNKAVKKTLTIPEWLNERAVEAGLNFSQVLQDALKEKLDIIA